MRALVQRVSHARVEVDGSVTGEIGHGLLIFLGVAKGDEVDDAIYLADKIAGLRIFNDTRGKMNLDLRNAGGQALVVSQFTLYGDCRKGRRPSFDLAAPPELARSLYAQFIDLLSKQGVVVATGIFQADMKVHLMNDGPVTVLCESPDRKKSA